MFGGLLRISITKQKNTWVSCGIIKHSNKVENLQEADSNYYLPLLDEICNWMYTEETEKLCQELATIVY